MKKAEFQAFFVDLKKILDYFEDANFQTTKE